MNIGRLLFFLGLTVAVVALCIRYPLHIHEQMAVGKTLPGAIAHMFSFFTLVINTLILLIYLAHLKAFNNKLSFFRRPVIIATGVAAILIVMIVYHLLLSATHNPTGINVLTNILQHYVAPIIFPLWWYFEGRTQSIRWINIPQMMIIPTLYLAWVFSRGALIGEYPYDFLNVAEKGIAGVAPILAAIIILFIVLGAILVLLDRKHIRHP